MSPAYQPEGLALGIILVTLAMVPLIAGLYAILRRWRRRCADVEHQQQEMAALPEIQVTTPTQRGIDGTLQDAPGNKEGLDKRGVGEGSTAVIPVGT